MSDLSANLEALSAKTGIEQRNEAMQTFRENFSLVWRTWIARGEETQDRYEQAGRAVKEHIKEDDYMRGAMNHFAFLAGCIRRDQARSERIRAEMRAAKEAV